MIFNTSYDMYSMDSTLNYTDLNNKLFCTFTTPLELEGLVNSISNSYSIMYNKIFVLEVKDSNEYVLTYNTEHGNISYIPQNTILVHRKKDSNTLYTINALNELIKSLNGGVVDTNYRIENELRQLRTKIFKIVEL